jgi:hypothetical protein
VGIIGFVCRADVNNNDDEFSRCGRNDLDIGFPKIIVREAPAPTL